jgi:hypothetical protein
MTDQVRRRPDRNYAPDGGAAQDASSALRRSDEPTLDQLLAEPIVQLLMHCDRTNEVTIRDLLHQASAAGPASQAIESPSADDPTTIVGLLDETARLARTRCGSGANGRIWPAMMSAELPEGWAWAS